MSAREAESMSSLKENEVEQEQLQSPTIRNPKFEIRNSMSALEAEAKSSLNAAEAAKDQPQSAEIRNPKSAIQNSNAAIRNSKFQIRYSISQLLLPHWKALALAFIAVLGDSLTDLLEPWPLKIVFDNIIGNKKPPE